MGRVCQNETTYYPEGIMAFETVSSASSGDDCLAFKYIACSSPGNLMAIYLYMDIDKRKYSTDSLSLFMEHRRGYNWYLRKLTGTARGRGHAIFCLRHPASLHPFFPVLTHSCGMSAGVVLCSLVHKTQQRQHG
ncbi:uncharacterized protein HMPREF1120_04697 [Exophiala dermatitidis NIH/UT8656]|uniref:Uncharacterized protein n=1 Tax=Exophiala dermatitidis (strain ATCC 34100 / CBS 525.76 / NIH/UT8656) TaxID=858893 RepID=H6BXZ9_EXODN|nr:uncharacterized protein HMPREF1120_04697 [Exophiala dermatitidis NIH/UT8656]EHY56621.1 hypothetical protein HMPREF1120_04697 [Exophiala dermatitidis NIH/UT8656]